MDEAQKKGFKIGCYATRLFERGWGWRHDDPNVMLRITCGRFTPTYKLQREIVLFRKSMNGPSPTFHSWREAYKWANEYEAKNAK